MTAAYQHIGDMAMHTDPPETCKQCTLITNPVQSFREAINAPPVMSSEHFLYPAFVLMLERQTGDLEVTLSDMSRAGERVVEVQQPDNDRLIFHIKEEPTHE